MTRALTHIVTEDEDGMLLRHIARSSMHLTRHALSRAKYLDDGILLDGVRTFTNHPVHAGQQVRILIGDTGSDLAASNVIPCAGPLDIVYEDEDVVVIDKPAGLVTHPGPGHYSDTLGSRLLAHFESEGVESNFHPVHRLDRGTSGLLVIATSATAQHRLSKSLHTDGFVREYLACCVNPPRPPEGVIDRPIAPAPDHRSWRVDDGGKRAVTLYRTICSDEYACILVKLETGRTHQIRVHLASVGCPLVGDAAYGTADELIDRPALHSHRLSFIHPMTGERLDFTSRPPDDMGPVLARSGYRG